MVPVTRSERIALRVDPRFSLPLEKWDEFVAALDEPARPVAEVVELLSRLSVFE